MNHMNTQNNDLDPAATTLSEDDYYALICEIAWQDSNDPDSGMGSSDATAWGCRMMSEYRKHHGQQRKRSAT